MERDVRLERGGARRRRGVTLVEMLVTVAVLVIIMTIMVQVFQAATGALTAAQTIQQLDDQLKLLDSTIRADLGGVTARFTPSLDPAKNLGYFEYGENEFADLQGEDGDDYLRFTAKAPAGRPFTGRMWVSALSTFYNPNVMPITVTSEYAEIIYFLRNGNLYRRVLLVEPDLQSAIYQVTNNQDWNNPKNVFNPFFPKGLNDDPVNLVGSPVSWQGVNDLSAHPATRGGNNVPYAPIVLNTLGMLTNRENRFASPRFADDFTTLGAGAAAPDGLTDDLNGDNVPDYYPTLYPGLFPSTAGGVGKGPVDHNGNPIQLVYEQGYGAVPRVHLGLMGFPWVFPAAYSRAQSLPNATYTAGWIHAPAPVANVPQQPPSFAQGAAITFDSSVQSDGNGNLISGPLAYLRSINHNPLDLDDNLPTAVNPSTFTSGSGANLNQTWWGFPTWREMLSPLWNDPTVQVNIGVNPTMPFAQQPHGLALLTTQTPNGPAGGDVSQGVLSSDRPMLPAMTAIWRINPQLYTDGWGDPASNGKSFFFDISAVTPGALLWTTLSWEDDLIMTNVRSFDVKAYDNSIASYVDLGWGDDFRIAQQFNDPNYNPGTSPTPYIPQAPYLVGNFDENTQTYFPTATPALKLVNGQVVPLLTSTFAHEGRIPPLIEDLRFDAQWGQKLYPFPAGNTYSGNIGDDNPGVVRLRRVWDSWSTEYSQAQSKGVFVTGFPEGPPFSPPVYPSYPAPYPAALRGIQIQIRVADPTNQRVKSLTIIQDFTDKLQ